MTAKKKKSKAIVKKTSKIRRNDTGSTHNKFNKSKVKGGERSERQLRMIKETVKALTLEPRLDKCSVLLNISRQALHNRKKKYPEIMQIIESRRKEMVNSVTDRIILRSDHQVQNVFDLSDKASSEDVRLRANIHLLSVAGIQPKKEQNQIQVNILNKIDKDKNMYEID